MKNHSSISLSSEKIFLYAFLIVSVFLLFFLPYISFDFGITFDEKLHNEHGKVLLSFFEGKSDDAKKNPFEENGKLKISKEDGNDFSGMNVFGGFFDFLSVFVFKYFGLSGEYETRHVINSLFGLLGIIFTGLVAARIGGWRAGLLALLFIALSPRFIGHSMNNPKDIPFAAMYIFNIYFLLKFFEELPKPKFSTILVLGVGIAVASCIRISGLLLLGYLLFFLVARIINYFFVKILDKNDFPMFLKSFVFTLAVFFLSYFLILVFWPYLRENPFTALPKIISKMSNFDAFNAYDLFDGQWLNRWEIPWYFVPKWIFISTPLFIPTGIFISLILFIKKYSFINRKKALFVIFTFTFPVIYIIMAKSNIYGDARHALFCYPPIVVCCALAFENLLRASFFRYSYAVISLILAAFMLEPLFWMKNNHPNEVVYFSPLIGGTKGAFKKYETEYYGNAIRQGVEWIQHNVAPEIVEKPVQIRVWYGSKICSDYYIEKKEGYKYVLAFEESLGWDYQIVMAAQAKLNKALLENWPPDGTVHEIEAGGAPLLAIVKNYRTKNDLIERMKQSLNHTTSAAALVNYSLEFFHTGDYPFCIAACEKALDYNPNHAVAYNNMCSAFNNLSLFKEAAEAGKTAVALNPQFQLAKNNYQYSLSMINSKTDKTIKARNYINLSLAYYHIGKYEKCIECCRKSLELKPANATAYNNICASMNALNKWRDAVKACEKALEIKNDFDLAKNNLNYAKSKLVN